MHLNLIMMEDKIHYQPSHNQYLIEEYSKIIIQSPVSH